MVSRPVPPNHLTTLNCLHSVVPQRQQGPVLSPLCIRGMLCRRSLTETLLFSTCCFIWEGKKGVSRLFWILDLYVDCLCWVEPQAPAAAAAAAAAASLRRTERLHRTPAAVGGNPSHDLNSTLHRPPLHVFSSPFLLSAVPSSKSRTTVKVITMKNSSACIYGASQSSGAKSRTGNITSL